MGFVEYIIWKKKKNTTHCWFVLELMLAMNSGALWFFVGGGEWLTTNQVRWMATKKIGLVSSTAKWEEKKPFHHSAELKIFSRPIYPEKPATAFFHPWMGLTSETVGNFFWLGSVRLGAWVALLFDDLEVHLKNIDQDGGFLGRGRRQRITSASRARAPVCVNLWMKRELRVEHNPSFVSSNWMVRSNHWVLLILIIMRS